MPDPPRGRTTGAGLTAVPLPQRAEFDRHMAACPSCVDYLKTYEKTIELAKTCADNPVPDEVPESLVQAILEARKRT